MGARRLFAVVVGVCVVAAVVGCHVRRRVEPVVVVVKEAPRPGPTKIVLDSSDAQGIEKQGEWPDGLGGEDWGAGCLFAFKGKGECKLVWRPNLPRAGRYRVSVWFGGDPNSDHATDSPFTVYYSGGKAMFKIDQTKTSGGWKSLGTFDFNAGTSGYVELTNNANGNVVADAVMFERVE